MKRTLIVMLSIIAVLFGFASCDNTTSPEDEAVTVVDYQFATENDVSALDHNLSSITFDEENECADISQKGAYYQAEMTNAEYTISYDLIITPAAADTTTLEFNHNFVTSTHEGQGYVVFTIGTEDVKIEGRPETNALQPVNMGTVTFGENESTTISMEATYQKLENGGTVTVTANGGTALTVNIPSNTTPEDIFWCISAVSATGCSIDNFKVTTI